MKVLVTGATGFVGNYVVAELKNRKHAIKEFSKELGQNILRKKDCEKACKGVDVVVHLAALIEGKGKEIWEVNVNGTKNLLKAAEEAGVKKFFYLSTTGIYGFTKGKTTLKTNI